MQLRAVACGHMQSYAPVCSYMQLYAGLCSGMRPHAVLCSSPSNFQKIACKPCATIPSMKTTHLPLDGEPYLATSKKRPGGSSEATGATSLIGVAIHPEALTPGMFPLALSLILTLTRGRMPASPDWCNGNFCFR